MTKGTWFIHDYETQNHKYYGSLASPHCPDNYIVATGWCIDNSPIKSLYFDNAQEAKESKWFEALNDAKVYVAHNATFEIHWNLKTYPEIFLNWVKNGGWVFCTQYAEFLLSHQQDMYPTLEDCAVKYGGTRKIDEVKILWEQGVLTSDIDQALLMKYLADPNEGDIANTRHVCFAQVKQLKERGMWAMFKERMDSLLFNAIATFYGLHVDMDVASKNQAEQEQDIVGIKKHILALLPDDVPEELEFSFTSDYHRSAFLFGGTVQYKAKVPYDPPKFEQVEAYEYKSSDGLHTHYEPITSTYTPSHYDDTVNWLQTVFKSGKNKGQPKVFKIDSDVPKLKWGDKQYTFKGLINFDDLPQNVSEQYIGKRAEFKGKRELVDGTPVYSTGKDSLDVLATYTDAAKPIKQLAALIKDTGTYYLQVDEKGNKSGMLQFVEPDNIIHHQLNNCATVTGRLSGSKPNMQNIPRDGTSKVKEMFTSRFGTDGRIVEVDYSALEVVTLASISGDSNLSRMLIEGIDMHCYRLAAKLKEPYEEVFEKCHNKEHPQHKLYKQMRTDIKPRAFAHQYGASAAGIAYSTGCTVEDAEEFKRIEFELFPESNEFPAKYVRPMVERTGNEALPHREFNEQSGWALYRRGYFQANSGTCYSFRQYEKRVDGQKIMDYKDTQIANYWCQGEASFIVQAACGRVIRWLIDNNFFDGKVLPINTVHDAIYLDCATEELARFAGAKVREIMEGTPTDLCRTIPALLEWGYNKTPFPAAAECGINMMSKEDID